VANGVYDPSARSWFTGSTPNELTLQFYRETFSQQLVFNMAVKQLSETTVGANNLVIVASALMLISDVASVVQSVTLAQSGTSVIFLSFFLALFQSILLSFLSFLLSFIFLSSFSLH
jgi:hypothetical protein